MKQILRVSRIWILALVLLAGAASYCVAQEGPSVTPQQRDQLKKLARDTKGKMEAQRRVLKDARQDLFDAYMDYNLDDRRVKADLDRIHRSQLNLLTIHLDSQLAIRGILSADQFGVFSGKLKEKHHHGAFGMAAGNDEPFAGNLFNKNAADTAGLSPAQLKRLQALMGQMNKRGLIIDRLKQASKQLIGLYSAYNLDVAGARKLINSIHQSQTQLSELNHKRQQVLRSIVTQIQFEQLKRAAKIKPHGPRQRRQERV